MALRDKIKVKKTISLSLTAEDWDLYTSKPGAETIAAALNLGLENCVNKGMGLQDTRRYLDKMMREEEFARYGTSDSEPVWVLDKMLQLIYGDSDV